MVDEVFRSDIGFEDDKVFHKVTQPSEDTILHRNQELRKNPGVLQDLGHQSGKGGIFGRQVASIPFIIYEKAIRDGYELNSGDNEHRSKELFRFLQSEEGKKCIVQEGAVK